MLHDPQVELWRTMLLTVELVYDHLGKKLATRDCSYPRFRVLFALYFDAPLSATQLAKRTRVSRANMSSFVRRLQLDQLIVACPLAPSVSRPKYRLSRKGTKYAESLMEFHFSNIRALGLVLDSTSNQKWHRLLERLESEEGLR